MSFLGFVSPEKLREAGVLSMNRRNYEVIARHNHRRLYPLVDDKVKTKQLANDIGLTTPHLIASVSAQYEVKNFLNLVKNDKSFVIKPAHGSGGKGVLVIQSYTQNHFRLPSGRVLRYREVYQHISNILSGLYSLGGRYDTALFEEMVHFSDVFKNYSYQGIPDVRLIIYEGYPVLAMMRLATKESAGRANLHQGAVGVGIDIKTGRAISAVQHNKPVRFHPDTKADLMQLSVPFWKEHLLIAAQGYEMTGLGYLGADIVLDKNKGPMVLELNARPGLAIQIANQCGLRSVLKRVERDFPRGLSFKERVEYVLSTY